MVTKAPYSTLQLGPLLMLTRDEIVFNPWNPNKMDGFMYSKAVESIQQFGMVDPVLVRELQGGVRGALKRYEVIDGEHRCQACIDLGTLIPAHSVGVIPDDVAKRLTIALNEIHGQADPADMGKLLNELLSGSSIEDLLVGLPMTEDTLAAFSSAAGIEWPTTTTPPASSPAAPSPGNERWVERTYRVPSSVAEVLDQAIAKAKGDLDPGATDAQALEVIAAEFMAG